jgi:hypothetical protein
MRMRARLHASSLSLNLKKGAIRLASKTLLASEREPRLVPLTPSTFLTFSR